MNLLSRALNALTFANVNTLGELRSLLRKIDVPAMPERGESRTGAATSALNPAAVSVHHGAQGAL